YQRPQLGIEKHPGLALPIFHRTGYDKASNRTSMTDPQSETTVYGYDTLNRLTSLVVNGQNPGFGFGYDGLNRPISLTRPNGINTSYNYDPVSRLLSVLHKLGTTTLDGATYTYDNAANRKSRNDQRTNTQYNYTYDTLNQLTMAKLGSVTKETYSYDSVGNRLTSFGVSPYQYNSSNELTSTPSGSYTYDANGNTLSDASGKSYTWDFENRLTQVVNSGVGTTTFKYDPFGRRIQKSGPLGTTNYLYDGKNLSEELDNAGNVLARYTQDLGVDRPLAMLRSGATSYYQPDGLGSITSLSNSAGALANTYTYDSFGKLATSTGTLTNPFQYTGREFDPETGIYEYRHRYYDQNVGRFLSEDPVRSPIQTDRYKYVRNSPLNRVDSSGLSDHSHSQSSCTLVSTLRLLLWTSESNRTPTSDWYFKDSHQMHAEEYVPWVIVTCIWERTYGAELWGHWLTELTYKCSSDSPCWLGNPSGHSEWTEHRFKSSTEDMGPTTDTERTTTSTVLPIGAEDETNDIMCVTTPGMRP
ncbi:MAG: RHS repeat-associated core domain-containing protein, partial [Candidatus Sulfotelmatobacter sp.]